MLQAFLNRLHASALAARQSQYHTAPLTGGPSSKGPLPSPEPTTNPSELVEADVHTALSDSLPLANPVSMLRCQAASETATQLRGTAAMALSAEDPPAVEAAAARSSRGANSPETTSPLKTAALLGAGPVAGAMQADGAAVAFGYTLAAEGQDAVASISACAAAAADNDAAAAADDAVADAEPGGVGGGAVPDALLSLEWLRSAPPDVAAAFLMSVEGIAQP